MSNLQKQNNSVLLNIEWCRGHLIKEDTCQLKFNNKVIIFSDGLKCYTLTYCLSISFRNI